MKIDEIRIIEREMIRLLPIFFNEMVDYVSVDKRRDIEEKIKNNIAHQLIGFDNGIGAWCNGEKIIFSVQNSDMFLNFAEKPDYGKKKNLELVKPEAFVDNEKDYMDYIDYMIAHGITELEYCLQILPHQIMHLIGSSGGILGEGVTELRTREICQKHRIKCAPVLHPKETKLVKKIESVVGKMLLNEASFLKDFSIIERILEIEFGEEKFKEIYNDLCIDYRNYAADRSIDPIEHYKKYREIDFEKIYKLIDSRDDTKINV